MLVNYVKMIPSILLSSTILTSNVLFVLSAPTTISINQAMTYLAKYGYMDQVPQQTSNSRSMITSSDKHFHQAILDFQSFAGLNPTGILDEETSILMRMPRCGVRDPVRSVASTRNKRYVLEGSYWLEKGLKYNITNYTNRLLRADVDLELAKAAKVWTDVTELSLTHQKSDEQKVHIHIRFESGEHGDGYAFDGPNNTLAHAFFPQYGGDIHFDDSENWTITSNKGVNLFQVAVHEFGHSLGLSHSNVKSSVMYAHYNGYDEHFSLDIDDITAIQILYGNNNAELCTPNATIDTIFTGPDNETYVFKGEKYWRLEVGGIASGYPRYIWKDWLGLPNSIDAAFTWTDGRTYFFKGSKYWRFTSFALDEGYPKNIRDGFPGAPSNMDTALVWSGNGKIYFFKGRKYWRFDPTVLPSPPVHSIYPKDIHPNWKGLPNSLDAGFQYTNGKTYFFKHGRYWRFNDVTLEVDKSYTKHPYPRPAGDFFGCEDQYQPLKIGNISDFVDDSDGLQSYNSAHNKSSQPGRTHHMADISFNISKHHNHVSSINAAASSSPSQLAFSLQKITMSLLLLRFAK